MTTEDISEPKFPHVKGIRVIHRLTSDAKCVMFYSVEYRLTLLHSSSFKNATGTTDDPFIYAQPSGRKYFSRGVSCRSHALESVDLTYLGECSYVFWAKRGAEMMDFLLKLV